MPLSPPLLYLLKANVALLLFAAAYFGLLRRLTFFTLNRFYLLFALGFAAAYPALPLPALFPAEAAPVLFSGPVTAAVAIGATAAPAAGPVDWAAAGWLVYGGGVALLLGRLLVQLLSLRRVRRASRPAVVGGQPVRNLAGAVSPFSFWQTIYLNPAQHPAAELAAVLRHEQVHVRQWHTLDVLLAEIIQALAWCNPAAWLLARAVRDNLEYLADQAALQTGLDPQAYQYSLLRLSRAATEPALVSHFTFPTLKNRVAMMNTPLSSTGQLARYGVAVPLVLTLALGFSAAQVRAQGAGPVVPAKAAASKAPSVAVPSTQQPAAAIRPVATGTVQPEKVEAPATIGQAKPTPARVTTRSTAPPATSIRIATNSQKVSGPSPVYYVDGKVNNGDISAINPKDIASISVFKGESAVKMAGAAGAAGVVVITTKPGQDQPDVWAFNEKHGVSAPPPAAAEQPKSVPYLAAPALAYITKNHPDARLLGVTEMKATDGGAPRYQAEIAIGRRPGYLLFDGQGQFISEASTPYVR
ncbi:MAG TPA: M56 family metallopeptidase [Hymenobacter sp.]|jgi:hypothetical protein